MVLPGSRAGWAVPGAVRVQGEVRVSGRNILLGDIATLEGDYGFIDAAGKIFVGRAPFPGQTRELKRGAVATRLKRSGIDPDRIVFTCPQVVTVRCDCREYSRADIAELTRRFIMKSMPWEESQVRIDDLTGDAVCVPDRDITWRFEPTAHEDYRGRFRADLLFYSNSRLVQTVRVSADITVVAPVVAAVRSIARNDIITPEDVTLTTSDISHLPDSVLHSTAAVIGKQAKTAIRSGTPLESAMIEPRAIVSRGEIVTLYIDRQQFSISTRGRALQDGAVGESIRVANLASDKNVYGIVTADKRIRVEY